MNSQNLKRFDLMVTLSDYSINKRRLEKRKAKQNKQIQKTVPPNQQREYDKTPAVAEKMRTSNQNTISK